MDKPEALATLGTQDTERDKWTRNFFTPN